MKKDREQACYNLSIQNLARKQNHVTMIHRNVHKCNIFSENSLLNEDTYKTYIDNLSMFALECNSCHHKGTCIRYGFYERGYLIKEEDLREGRKIRIQRVKCKDCNSTHALQPEEIVPYAQYSLPFILLVLMMYFQRQMTVEVICATMGITAPVLYRWRKLFQRQKDTYLGVLTSGQWSNTNAIVWLQGRTDYGAEFAGLYLQKTKKMPMQRHSNPPNTRRPVMCVWGNLKAGHMDHRKMGHCGTKDYPLFVG